MLTIHDSWDAPPTSIFQLDLVALGCQLRLYRSLQAEFRPKCLSHLRASADGGRLGKPSGKEHFSKFGLVKNRLIPQICGNLKKENDVLNQWR